MFPLYIPPNIRPPHHNFPSSSQQPIPTNSRICSTSNNTFNVHRFPTYNQQVNPHANNRTQSDTTTPNRILNNNNNNSNNRSTTRQRRQHQSQHQTNKTPNSNTAPRNRHSRIHSHPNPRKHTRAIVDASHSGNPHVIERAVDAAIKDNYHLNAINYTTIAAGYVRCRLPSRTFSTLTAMRNKGLIPTPATLRVAYSAVMLMDYSNREAAVSSMVEALRWSVQAGTERCTRTWNMCMGAMIHHGGIDEVLKILFAPIISSQQTDERKPEHEYAEGEWHWKHNNIPKWDACTFNQVIAALGKAGRLSEAMGVFGKLLLLSSSSKLKLDVITVNVILDSVVSYDGKPPLLDGQEATILFVNSVLDLMIRNHIKPEIITETLLLRVLCRANEKTQSTQFKHAVESNIHRVLFSNGSKDFKYKLDKIYFDAALISTGLIGNMNLLHKVFTMMIFGQQLGIDKLTIRALLISARNSGDAELAQIILNASSNLQVAPDEYAYTTAIATCARSNPPNIQIADQILQHAYDKGIRYTAPMINAAISCRGNDLNAAVQFWKRLRFLAMNDESIHNALTDRMVYDSLFRVCGRNANPRQALRTFYAAKNAGHLSPNSTESRAVFSAFMRGVDETQDGRAEVEHHIMKRNYLRLLRTECGTLDDEVDWPIERIRIKW